MVDRRHDLVKIPYVKKQTKKTAAERRERKQKMDTKSEKHCCNSFAKKNGLWAKKRPQQQKKAKSKNGCTKTHRAKHMDFRYY